MRFDVMTLFPQMIEAVAGESILGRAMESGLIQVNAVNIRDFSANKHKKVDDYPYGGGNGMVMMPQPIFDAYSHITQGLDYKPRTIYMSPQGKVLTQQLAQELAASRHLIILCGHYEGVDERVLDSLVDEEISIGDYVLTGGELPALVMIDSISRLIPGVLSNEESHCDESHSEGLLEYPQYTRPYEYQGQKVPDILMTGHHANIQQWRRMQSLKRTRDKRPDLFARLDLKKEDKELLLEKDNL